MRGMNVLIVGAFGNIGTSSLKELVRSGHRVRCLDLKNRANMKTAAEFDGLIEVQWGDVRCSENVRLAVRDQEVIVHLAGILPPTCNESPQVAEETNVGGTKHLIEAAKSLEKPPRLLFASTFAVFGYTQDAPFPRRVTDPTLATDCYTQHKLQCEDMIRESGLEWLIFRFTDVPPLVIRRPHPIMFEIPLANRLEVLHTHDAGLAIANALERPNAWGKILLIGGGTRCQVYFRDYLGGMLRAMGVGPLPEEAFTTNQYYTDWVDTEESQRLLGYQQHSYEDIIRDITRRIGMKRRVMPFLRPFIRRSLLKLSPYWRAHASTGISSRN